LAPLDPEFTPGLTGVRVEPELELAPLLLPVHSPPPPRLLLQFQSGASPLAGEIASPRKPITVAIHCWVLSLSGSFDAPRFLSEAPELESWLRPALNPPELDPLELRPPEL
jgi:hypothetical protein